MPSSHARFGPYPSPCIKHNAAGMHDCQEPKVTSTCSKISSQLQGCPAGQGGWPPCQPVERATPARCALVASCRLACRAALAKLSQQLQWPCTAEGIPAPQTFGVRTATGHTLHDKTHLSTRKSGSHRYKQTGMPRKHVTSNKRMKVCHLKCGCESVLVPVSARSAPVCGSRLSTS